MTIILASANIYFELNNKVSDSNKFYAGLTSDYVPQEGLLYVWGEASYHMMVTIKAAAWYLHRLISTGTYSWLLQMMYTISPQRLTSML